MALVTTTIGAFPKPAYVPIRDWFGVPGGPDNSDPTGAYLDQLTAAGETAEARFVRAAREVIRDQVATGIDIPTDGEVRRENYIHYHCRHLDGIDFERLSERLVRGNYTAHLPTVTAPVRARDAFLPHDWKVAQTTTERPVKITLPGPMTIADTVVDSHYGDPNRLGRDLATALNVEIHALARAGCRHIQVDEPLFARKVEVALDYGFGNLSRCFDGIGDEVTRTVHICCGYPDRLDVADYPKAPRQCYLELAEAIDAAAIDAVSLEDAHRPNDLAALLPRFRDTTVVLGAIAVALSRIETAAEIGRRLADALHHIEAERLWVAPDCGFGLLGREQALAKLANMVRAARDVG